MKNSLSLKCILFVLSLLASSQAFSAVWTSDFTIANLYVSGENNFQYRVYGATNLPAACTSSPNWAYVNKGDAGSDGQVAALFTAFAMGRPIRMLVEPTNGFCHILELFLTA